MIPKIIHYCWFGRNPLPKSAQKCIASWRKYLPEYEIKEWNEDNFDVNMIQYTKDAYAAKKYAFVSDYARFWILYHYGGVYFDTDVEVIRPMDDIIEKGAFMGLEIPKTERGGSVAINPGLGLGSERCNPLYASILREFGDMSFYDGEGKLNHFTMIPMVTSLFVKNGLKGDNVSVETILGISIYPTDFFNPYDTIIGKLSISSNTRSIHWYAASWFSAIERFSLRIKRVFRRII